MQTDILIYGATTCGLIAALAAARSGCSVVVLARENGIGGAVTGGLGICDPPLTLANWFGVTKEWIDAVAEISGYSSFDPYKWNAAPSAFRVALEDLLAAEPLITLRLRETIERVHCNEVRQVNGHWAETAAQRARQIRSIHTAPCSWLADAPASGDLYSQKRLSMQTATAPS